MMIFMVVVADIKGMLYLRRSSNFLDYGIRIFL